MDNIKPMIIHSIPIQTKMQVRVRPITKNTVKTNTVHSTLMVKSCTNNVFKFTVYKLYLRSTRFTGVEGTFLLNSLAVQHQKEFSELLGKCCKTGPVILSVEQFLVFATPKSSLVKVLKSRASSGALI